MKLKTILLLAGTLLLAMALSAGAEEGHAIAVLGDVTMQRGGQSLTLKRGTPIEVGDRIRTGDGAAAQLLMSDETILSVRQKSEVEITSYRFAADKPEDSAALFSLIKGGLRTLTGKIGKYSRPNFKVNAQVAVIGIRGTHFRLQLCDKDCEADGVQAKDGLYGGVSEGRIGVTNKAGETVFGVDEYFFLADDLSKPERLPAPPALLNDRLASLAKARKSGATAAAGSSTETNPVAFLPEPAPLSGLTVDSLSTLTQIRPDENLLDPSHLAHEHDYPPPPDDGGFVDIGSPGDIRGQIIWMTDADIDLHLLTPTGGHVAYDNKQVDLGNGAIAALDHDNLGGTIDIAPDQRVENIVVTGDVNVIPQGDYAFYANSFSGNNDGLPTTVQIRVTGDGNHTSKTDSFTLADQQRSSDYIVDFKGPNLAPQYRVVPQAVSP